MSTTKTCDHCGKPINKHEAVRVDVLMPSQMTNIMLSGKGSLKDRLKAAEDAVTHLRDNLDLHLDLHEQCYMDTLAGPITANVGAPS